MKSNHPATMLVSLALLFSNAAFAAAADKKPIGVSAAEYFVTVEVKDAKVIITTKGAGGYQNLHQERS
jgi:hypothetical protein